MRQLQAALQAAGRPTVQPTTLAVHGPGGMLSQLRQMMQHLTGCDAASILEVQQVTRPDPPPAAGSSAAAVADPGRRRHVYRVTLASKNLAETALRRRADLRTIRTGAYKDMYLDRWLTQQQREARNAQRSLAQQLSRYGVRFQWAPHDEQLLQHDPATKAYIPATAETVAAVCRGRHPRRAHPRPPAAIAAAAAANAAVVQAAAAPVATAPAATSHAPPAVPEAATAPAAAPTAVPGAAAAPTAAPAVAPTAAPAAPAAAPAAAPSSSSTSSRGRAGKAPARASAVDATTSHAQDAVRTRGADLRPASVPPRGRDPVRTITAGAAGRAASAARPPAAASASTQMQAATSRKPC